MSRINTILMFFLAFFLVLAGAAYSFLQSRSFGRLLSKAITEVSSKFDAKVSFSHLDVRFFPPGIALENVHLEYDREGTAVSAEAGELGVAFDLNMFQGQKIRLDEIYLREGFASIRLPKDESQSKHPWDQIQAELKKLPIELGTLTVSESRVQIFDVALDVHELSVSPGEEAIRFAGELKQLSHKSLPSSIDLLKVKGELRRETIKLASIQVLQKRSKISAKGQIGQWAEIAKAQADGSLETDIYVPDIHEWVDLDGAGVAFFDGIVRAKGKATWSQSKGPRLTANVNVNGLKSNFLNAESIEGEIVSNESGVAIPKLTLKNGREEVQLLKPATVWEQSSGKVLPDGVRARVQQLELTNALSILGDELKPLKGRLSGEVNFKLKGHDLYFKPVDGFKVEHLRLELAGRDNKIFDAPVLWVHGSEFRVVKGRFEMQGTVKAPRSQLEIKGHAGKQGVRFDIAPGPVQITDLGNIANLDLKGEGTNKITVSGTLADTLIVIEGAFHNFEILGYRLGHTQHKIEIDLGKGEVRLPHFKARKGRYDYSGTGSVAYKHFLMDLSIDIPNLSFSELKDAINPLADGLSFLPKDFEALLSSNVELYARDSISNLRVGADVYGQKITAYGESFKDTKFTFLYGNKLIQLKDFSATKETGRVSGSISYDLFKSELAYKLALRQLSSSELSLYKRLPLSLEFMAAGEFQGTHSNSKWRHRGFLGLSQSRVHDRAVPESTFEWDVRQDGASIDAKVARDWIVLSTTSHLEQGKPKVVSELTVDIPDLPLFIRGALGENPQLINSSGELSFAARFAVTDWQWNRLDLEAWLKTLKLSSNEIALQQKFDAPQVRINQGNVERWDFKINAPDLKVSSNASGDLRKNLIIKNTIDLDAKYFELLSRHLQRAEGRATAELAWFLSPGSLGFELSSEAHDMVVSTDLLPFAMSNLNYKLTFKNKELELHQFSFRPDSGKVSASGTVFLNGLEPDVNLRYSFDRATVPFRSRSSVTLSGDGMLFGNKPPYILNGDLTINRGSILNEINEFMGSGSATADTKYLPPEQGGPMSDLIRLDVAVGIENPVNVSNSMMDLFIAGDMKLAGDVLRPTGEGKLSTVGLQSKVFFKNNEYLLTKGEFLFSPRKPIAKPEFDIMATSVIANYKVTAKAFGTPDNFTFDLSSDPPLSKQNILSLIAFGYTDDLSNSIDPTERQNLTNIGVGSFIFDQFKVTDIVKKQFGLQVNLGTVFEQSSQSMLAGRSQDQGGVGTLARTRTATNIEVKKRLSEAMSLSVSSTVGGSIGQRQRMNLNYGLSRRFQLEGVYELRTNAEGTEDIIDNSIGGDIKYRQTFR